MRPLSALTASSLAWAAFLAASSVAAASTLAAASIASGPAQYHTMWAIGQ
jgi:hypothetical protein